MRHDSDPDVATEDLVAHAEGRLPAGSGARERVEAHLARHPEDAARVDAFRRQDAHIRDAFAGVADEPLPERVLPRSAHRRAPRAGPALGVAAALVVGLATGWLAARWTGEPLQNPAMRAFAERVAGRLTPAGSAPTPASQAGEIPDLSAAGLRPVAAGTPADMSARTRRFEYRDPSGTPVHLFVSRDIARATPAVRVVSTGSHAVAYWHRNGTTFALAGEIPSAYLRRVARDVMSVLDERPRRVLAEPPGPTTADGAVSGDEVIAVTPEPGGNGASGVAPGQGREPVPGEM